MSDYGLKIAETGNDVKTCDEKNLIFTSKYPVLKVQSSGSGSHTFVDNLGSVDLTTHNLGYRPFFAVWVDEGSGFELCTFTTTNIHDTEVSYMATATTTKLVLVSVLHWVLGEDETVDYAWVIFHDPVKDE